jgi:hypothetical protein
MAEPIIIANASGFYGDRFSAVAEQIQGGHIDVLTGDYLAELTMLILWKTREAGRSSGYANTFLSQMEHVLGECMERGIKVVTNAGGLNPGGLAADLRAVAAKLGIAVSVAHIEGDDLMPGLSGIVAGGWPLSHMDTGAPLTGAGSDPATANAYLGAWGITGALGAGADIVVCPRVTDASLVVGPAAWHHGWARNDWDALAGAVVAGHVLECGAQATGGNYAFFDEVPDLEHPGFPIAEVASDGSSVITKHEGTGGAVTVGTVTAQILYEISSPRYLNPDVTAHFNTITLGDDGHDRITISSVRGSPPPPCLKVAINLPGGYRNAVTLGVVGLDVAGKVALVERSLMASLGDTPPATLEFDLALTGRADADTNAEASSMLTISAMDPDRGRVGRRFTSAVIELALASYPGFFATAPPSGASAYGVYWPALVPRGVVAHEVVLEDGTRIAIDDPETGEAPALVPTAPQLDRYGGSRTLRVPLGVVAGARSGDKGGNANIGVWARSEVAYSWLSSCLTVDVVKELLPETAPLHVERYELQNVRGLNFVVYGLLGDGVASSTRFDPQAKSLGEWLRSRLVDVPVELLEDSKSRQTSAS